MLHRREHPEHARQDYVNPVAPARHDSGELVVVDPETYRSNRNIPGPLPETGGAHLLDKSHIPCVLPIREPSRRRAMQSRADIVKCQICDFTAKAQLPDDPPASPILSPSINARGFYARRQRYEALYRSS